MIIVYESKTGFTRRYAEMLSKKTGWKMYATYELPKNSEDEILFLGWMKAGRIQGLSKMNLARVKAVCATGTARYAEPSEEKVKARNKIKTVPFFYLRGGCLPLKQLKGADRILLSLFVKMLKMRKDKDEETKEAIEHIVNGFDGVSEENLKPVYEWAAAQKSH